MTDAFTGSSIDALTVLPPGPANPRRRAVAQACAATACLALAGGVGAQPVALPMEVPDVLTVHGALDVEQHDNVFRTAGGPSDTVLRATAGVRLERVIGLQRVGLEAFVVPVRYLNNADYNYLGYGLGATWNWAVGRGWFGDVVARVGREQTPFDLLGAYSNNLQTLASLRALAGLRLTQAWAAIAAFDQTHASNSLLSQQPADYSRTGLEAGVRYAPQSALELDAVWRHETARYPNRQIVDANGTPLPDAVDNAYTQDTPLVRLAYRPHDASRIAGQLGYTQRRYDNLSQRDFSGVTLGLDAEWPLSGAVVMRGGLLRSIEVAAVPSANYIEVRGVALRPAWQITGRTRLEATVAYSNRRYLGDPGTALSGGLVREDHLRQYGLELRYQIARRTWLSASVRQLSRDSNYPGYDFTDRWAGVGVSTAF
jgi:hypothetical protein